MFDLTYTPNYPTTTKKSWLFIHLYFFVQFLTEENWYVLRYAVEEKYYFEPINKFQQRNYFEPIKKFQQRNQIALGSINTKDQGKGEMNKDGKEFSQRK